MFDELLSEFCTSHDYFEDYKLLKKLNRMKSPYMDFILLLMKYRNQRVSVSILGQGTAKFSAMLNDIHIKSFEVTQRGIAVFAGDSKLVIPWDWIEAVNSEGFTIKYFTHRYRLKVLKCPF